MPSDLITVFVTAAATSIVTGATLLLGVRRHGLDGKRLVQEQAKMNPEIAKLRAETEKLRADTKESRTQANTFGAALIEIEKQKLIAINSMRNQIYPQLLELVYRLLNELRDAVLKHQKSLGEEYDEFDMPDVC